MKLFEVPRAIADLEIGDIVYIRQNGKIKQAKLVAYKTYYDLEAKSYPMSQVYAGIEIKEKSEYQFITPDGEDYFVDGNNWREYPVYYTINDLRDDRKMSFYYSSEENCKQAYLTLCNAMSKKLGDNIIKDYRIVLYDIRKEQICEHKWGDFLDSNGTIKLKFLNREKNRWIDVYHSLNNLLNTTYYTTKEECAEDWQPDVMTF